jgi:hypothetical protein
MAYDIHIGTSPKKHDYRFSITENIHNELFDLLRSSDIPCVLIFRMSDYYSDAQYKPYELARFERELTLIKQSLINKKEITGALGKLLAIVTEAIQTKTLVYGFAD